MSALNSVSSSKAGEKRKKGSQGRVNVSEGERERNGEMGERTREGFKGYSWKTGAPLQVNVHLLSLPGVSPLFLLLS